MIVAVTGGRDYANQARVDEGLDTVHGMTPITLLIHGAASGADTLAADWAERHGIPVKAFPARWDDLDAKPCRIRLNTFRKPYNALAGFTRNLQMLREGEPDLLVVFPGGSGTDHCHANALNMGIPSLEIHDE